MTPLRAAPRLCVVCAAALPHAAGAGVSGADAYPVCSTVACRMVVSRRAEMGEAGFRHYLQLQSRMTMERAANMQVAHARVAAQARANTAAWGALRVKAMALGEGGTGREFLRLLVPSGPARARRLSQRRRARFRMHLLKLAAEVDAAGAPALVANACGDANGGAANGGDADGGEAHRGNAACAAAAASAPPRTASPTTASAMPAHLCGLCGGGCCTQGADHAYLSADTLRRVMAQQPGLSSEALVADYLARLPAASKDGSCINHTAHGCALPASLRSDICNNYACEALARLQHLQRTSAAPHVVLVVRRKQDNWQRKDTDRDNSITARAVVSEAGSRRYAAAALRSGAEPVAADSDA